MDRTLSPSVSFEQFSADRLNRYRETLMHQLKTPLGAAEGAALLLENEEITSDPKERRRFAILIRRNLSLVHGRVDHDRAGEDCGAPADR